MQEPEKRMLRLEGVVDKVLFFNEQNGYIVLELETDHSIETVVGELGEIEDGETLLVEGEYITHSKFGTQFKASYCERKLPSTAENIRKYLSSGTISGIGPSLAKRIVDVFGDETLEVMEHHPEKLRTIKGISEKKCQEIAREVQKIFSLRTLMIYLSQYQIPARYAMKAFQQWGVNSRDVIDGNPYALCSELIGLPFQKAEVLARSLRIALDSEQRILAGLQYLLTENTFSGHTCLPLDKLQPLSCKYLGIGEQDFYANYNQALENQQLYEYKKGEREFVYLPEYYIAESYIADRINVILEFSAPEDYDYEALIDLEEQEKQIKYESLQRKAITTALSRGLMVLTGGPGTGKTTTLTPSSPCMKSRERRC